MTADHQAPDTGVVNLGSDLTPKLVLRDSAQVATRIPQASCGPGFTTALGLSETQDHCGATSIWDVASGGRMRMTFVIGGPCRSARGSAPVAS